MDYQDMYSEQTLTSWQVSVSLTQSVIPTCFKQATIVPVPEALTSVAMKCCERLVMANINNTIPDSLNPLQFAECTIVPSKLIPKLRSLGLNISLCNWILDFLTS